MPREAPRFNWESRHSTFNPELQFARKLVTEGILGDIYYNETSGCRRRGNPDHTFIYQRTAGAGAIVDIGVYNMHNAFYLMGYPRPVRVSAITADYLSHKDSRFDEMDVEEAVRADGPSPIPPDGVILTNVIMDGIFRSQKQGKEVAVRVPEF